MWNKRESSASNLDQFRGDEAVSIFSVARSIIRRRTTLITTLLGAEALDPPSVRPKPLPPTTRFNYKGGHKSCNFFLSFFIISANLKHPIMMTDSKKEQHVDMQTDQEGNITDKPSEVQDESQYPTGIRLATIIASILLAMFLVALVCILMQTRSLYSNSNITLGPHNHRYRSSPNCQPVQCT